MKSRWWGMLLQPLLPLPPWHSATATATATAPHRAAMAEEAQPPEVEHASWWAHNDYTKGNAMTISDHQHGLRVNDYECMFMMSTCWWRSFCRTPWQRRADSLPKALPPPLQQLQPFQPSGVTRRVTNVISHKRASCDCKLIYDNIISIRVHACHDTNAWHDHRTFMQSSCNTHLLISIISWSDRM